MADVQYTPIQFNEGHTSKSVWGGWRRTIWDNIKGQLLNRAGDTQALQSYIDDLNKMLRAHRSLRVRYGSNSDWAKQGGFSFDNLDVIDYLDAIRTNYNFINTDHIGSSDVYNTYTNVKSITPREGDVPHDSAEGNWGSDGGYSAYNDLRRLLGRVDLDGDDWTDDDKTAINNYLEAIGYKMELEADPNNPDIKYYVINPLQKDPGQTPPEQTTGGRYSSATFERKPKNKDKWTDWRPLTELLVMDRLTDSRIEKLDKMKRFALKEAPFHQKKITNDYFVLSTLGLQAADVRAQSQRNLSSDINANLKQQMAYEDKAEEIEARAAQAKSLKYNTDIKEALDVANWNSDLSVVTANANRDTLAAKYNSILAAKAAAMNKKRTSINTYINNMYTSAGKFIRDKRVNEAKRAVDLASIDYSRTVLDLGEEVEKALSEIFSRYSQSITASLKRLYENPDSGLDDSLIAELRDILTNYNTYALSSEGRAKISSWFDNVPGLQSWYDLLKEEILRWANRQEKAAGEKALRIKASNPHIYSNLWDWSDFASGRSSSIPSPFTYKSGGKVSDNAYKFALLHLRVLERESKMVMRANENAMKDLNKALDRISKEELLLLRSVFK